MNDRETRRYDMFGRSKTFGTENTADFAAGSKALTHFANITQIIADLDLEKAKQKKNADTAREVLLDALRLDIQNIARAARAIAQDEPGFADDFRTPDSASQADLITTADAFILRLADQPADTAAQKAAKAALRAKFIAHELPADFAQDLVDDRAAIDRSDDEGEGDDMEGVASTAAIGRLIRAGMKEVNYLDAIMHNKYSRDADKFRAWQSASHIERAAKREKKPAGGTTPAKPTV